MIERDRERERIHARTKLLIVHGELMEVDFDISYMVDIGIQFSLEIQAGVCAISEDFFNLICFSTCLITPIKKKLIGVQYRCLHG